MKTLLTTLILIISLTLIGCSLGSSGDSNSPDLTQNKYNTNLINATGLVIAESSSNPASLRALSSDPEYYFYQLLEDNQALRLEFYDDDDNECFHEFQAEEMHYGDKYVLLKFKNAPVEYQLMLIDITTGDAYPIRTPSLQKLIDDDIDLYGSSYSIGGAMSSNVQGSYCKIFMDSSNNIYFFTRLTYYVNSEMYMFQELLKLNPVTSEYTTIFNYSSASGETNPHGGTNFFDNYWVDGEGNILIQDYTYNCYWIASGATYDERVNLGDLGAGYPLNIFRLGDQRLYTIFSKSIYRFNNDCSLSSVTPKLTDDWLIFGNIYKLNNDYYTISISNTDQFVSGVYKIWDDINGQCYENIPITRDTGTFLDSGVIYVFHRNNKVYIAELFYGTLNTGIDTVAIYNNDTNHVTMVELPNHELNGLSGYVDSDGALIISGRENGSSSQFTPYKVTETGIEAATSSLKVSEAINF